MYFSRLVLSLQIKNNPMTGIDLHGMGVALITPFREDDSVDYDALVRMVNHLVDN